MLTDEVDTTFSHGSRRARTVVMSALTRERACEPPNVQRPSWTTRLYLLDHGLMNIVIEVSDVHASPGTLADYEPVIDALDFEECGA